MLIWVLILGLANFAVYTFFYWYFQGDACNGYIEGGRYYLRGHFIHPPDARPSAACVSRGIWIYSFLHSISIWPTIGGVLAAMLVLSRPHIIATMDSDSLISGRTFVNAGLAIVTVVSLAITVVFVINLIQALGAAANGQNYGI